MGSPRRYDSSTGRRSLRHDRILVVAHRRIKSQDSSMASPRLAPSEGGVSPRPVVAHGAPPNSFPAHRPRCTRVQARNPGAVGVSDQALHQVTSLADADDRRHLLYALSVTSALIPMASKISWSLEIATVWYSLSS